MLEIDCVTKRFGPSPAVDRVSLRIEEGRFVSLLGPSGCGKTTLLRMIAGFETPTEGRILLDGRPIERLRPQERPFHMVFQRYALFPHLTVFENIAFGLRIRKTKEPEIRARVVEMLETVQLGGFENRLPRTLSGGQQQRVALARALVNRPRLLLLDEPLSALDLKLREKMQVELHALQRKLGLSFLFVTHDQGEALTLSDQIAVMRSGQVEQIGTPREIYDAPKSAFVAQFIGAMNFFRTAGPGRVVCIRPEKIRLSRKSTAGAHPGVIRRALFRGTDTQVFVASGLPGAPPEIEILDLEAGASWKEGQEIHWAFAETDARVLEDAAQ